jgi:hypothetical protein
MPEVFVEGWTTPIDYQLLKNGAPFDRTGMSIAITLRDKDGVVIPAVGSAAWLGSPAESKVRFTPDATDLTFARSPIGVHFTVTAPDGVASFPRGHALEWVISRKGGRP